MSQHNVDYVRAQLDTDWKERALKAEAMVEVLQNDIYNVYKMAGEDTSIEPYQVVLNLVVKVSKLELRRDELLALIDRMTRELPYPDEMKDWMAQRGALMAEVGTLRARVRELEQDRETVDKIA